MKDDLTPLDGEDSHTAARRSQMMPAFRSASGAHGVPLSWLLAFGAHETGFRNVRSPPGARDDVLGGSYGALQCSSVVAKEMGALPGASLTDRGTWMIADPSRGIDIGAKFIAHLIARVGSDLARVAASFNAGAGAVLGGHVPASTRDVYVPAVLLLQSRYAALDPVSELAEEPPTAIADPAPVPMLDLDSDPDPMA